tara:strand:+ start:4406 stop:4717 length:312 start_codon:yes stop_codon:yes gene_type:complete
MTHLELVDVSIAESMVGSIWKNKYTSRTATIIDEESLGKNGIVYTLNYHEFDEYSSTEERDDAIIKLLYLYAFNKHQEKELERINGKNITRYWVRMWHWEIPI